DGAQKRKIAAAADTSYGVDTNWYMDTGATNHITGEPEKLTMHEQYRGQDQVYTAANGVGMEISHIGQAVIKTPHKNLEI
uniref:Retrovirus-related Pol polyprotein from transposon TNT 1-94-like beta-barrel domain-containing protein n=1 Tax=Aegilops tauschii subsp. strangulata TaxID=200361 RepID=A0A453EQ70_AEGTS